MNITKKTFIGLMILFCCFSLVRGAEASVMASSDMALFKLAFSSPDTNAQLLWADEWYGEVSAFAQVLEKHSIPVTVRMRRGIEISAGCGQLASEVENGS